MSTYETTRALILESIAACSLPATDHRSIPDVSGAFNFCKGYIRCADDAKLLTAEECDELKQLLRERHPG